MVKIYLDDLRVNRTLGELSATWFSLFKFVYHTFQFLRRTVDFYTLIHFNYEKVILRTLTTKLFRNYSFVYRCSNGL